MARDEFVQSVTMGKSGTINPSTGENKKYGKYVFTMVGGGGGGGGGAVSVGFGFFQNTYYRHGGGGGGAGGKSTITFDADNVELTSGITTYTGSGGSPGGGSWVDKGEANAGDGSAGESSSVRWNFFNPGTGDVDTEYMSATGGYGGKGGHADHLSGAQDGGEGGEGGNGNIGRGDTGSTGERINGGAGAVGWSTLNNAGYGGNGGGADPEQDGTWGGDGIVVCDYYARYYTISVGTSNATSPQPIQGGVRVKNTSEYVKSLTTESLRGESITLQAYGGDSDNFLRWEFIEEGIMGPVRVEYTSEITLSNIKTDYILRAIFERKKKTVTLNLNNGVFSSTPSGWTKVNNTTYTRQYNYETSFASIVSSLPNPTRTGFTFTQYSPNTGTLTSDTTITSGWSENRYKITYVLQDDTRDPATITSTEQYYNYTQGCTLYIPARPHYAFNGWYTASGTSGGTKITSVAASESTPQNRTVYARWTPLQYTITLNADGGVIASGWTLQQGTTTYTAKHTYGSVLSLPTPTRSRCTFNGWHLSTISGEKWTSIPAYDDQNRSFIAEWNGISYTVTLDYRKSVLETGTTLSTEPSQVTGVYDPTGNHATDAVLPAPITSQNSKYVFYGWYTEYNNGVYSGTVYNGNDKFPNEGTLYARWTRLTVTLAAETGQGTTLPSQTVYVRPGSAQSVTFTVWSGLPQKDGCQFNGWSETNGPTETPILPEASINVPITNTGLNGVTTKTLYALWSDYYYVTINYDANSGTWGTDPFITNSTVADEGAPRNVYLQFPTGSQLTKTGCIFKGWDTDPRKGGAGTYTSDGTNSIVAGSSEFPYVNKRLTVTLYAVWSDKHEVYFAGNGTGETYDVISISLEGYPTVEGTAPAMKVNTATTGKIPVLPVAQRSHYFHKGWSYNGTPVTENTEFLADVPASNPVLAQWVAEHRITFNGNGITTFPSTMLITGADETLDKLPELKDTDDYFVKGWYLDPKNEDDPVIAGETVFHTDTMVYAHWVASYRITFEPNGIDSNIKGAKCYPTSTSTDVTGRAKEYRPNERYPTPTCVGYVLDDSSPSGWWRKDTMASVGNDTTYTENVTLIAKWVAKNDCVITFNPDERYGTLPSGDRVWENVTFGKSYNYLPNQGSRGDFPIPAPLPGTNMNFVGWAKTSNTDANDMVVSTDPFDDLSHTTLYAIWTDGGRRVVFNPMGGYVAPAASVTTRISDNNPNGVLNFYPTPTRTGYSFIGWYDWPVYESADYNLTPSTSQDAIWAVYEKTTGSDSEDRANTVKYTLLVNTYGSLVTQYRYNPDNHSGQSPVESYGVWEDVTGWEFQSTAINTEDTIVIDTDGQSDVLTSAWAATRQYKGWEYKDNDVIYTPTYMPDGSTYFESLDELLLYDSVPKNHDIAEIRPSDNVRMFLEFKIPYGFTVMVIRVDASLDKEYTWTKDTATIEGVPVNGRWVDTTNDGSTVVLPNRTYTRDTTLYAHWVETPLPSTLSNTCYIERRLSKYTDDTIRLYLPTVTSIEDVVTASLVQKDTLMFGYQNKYVVDMGTSRRLSVSIERPNPMPYDDYSDDTNKWSNGKWYDTLLQFTDYWQNFGRDPITGSMIGGFKFHYIPMAKTTEDDRVDYSDLYPEIHKNVFIAGNVDVTFTDTVMRLTLPLAVGQMTSDSSNQGYEVFLESNLTDVPYTTSFTPEGVDFTVPGRPAEWVAPEGKMFSQWARVDIESQVTYRPGDTIPYEVVKEATQNGKVLTLRATWEDIGAGLVIIGNGLLTAAGINYTEYLNNVTTVDDLIHGRGHRYIVKKRAQIEILAIGGGGAGAGGMIQPRGNQMLDMLIFANNTTNDFYSGGAGGAGEVIFRPIIVDEGDTIHVHIGNGGLAQRPSDTIVAKRLYIEGGDGENTTITVVPKEYAAEISIVAKGGSGGQRNGTPGVKFYTGGNGGNNNTQQAEGRTASVGCKGMPGVAGIKNVEYTDWSDDRKGYWYGGGGGGASAFNHSFKIGSTYLTTGATEIVTESGVSKGIYRSVGGNGANNGEDANWVDSEHPLNCQYGGGGGSGCAGHFIDNKYGGGVTYIHKPGNGASGIVVMTIMTR